MPDTLYVVVETPYYGPVYGYIINPMPAWGSEQFETAAQDCIIAATDEYCSFAENADVPYTILAESVKPIIISTNHPTESYITWVN